MQHLPETGLGNPVTAVLIAYRAFDTMLEKVVLVLAVVGVWSLAADRYWGGAPGEARAERPEPTLAFLAQVLAPLGILVGIHVFWVGADEPGGAFQGGAILAAMWIIVMMARLTEAPQTNAFWLRLALVAGPLVFPGRGRCGGDFRGRIFRLSAWARQAGDPVHRGVHGPLHRRDPADAGGGAAATRAATMTSATLAGLVGAALVGLGLYGLIANPQPLRKILAFNLMGSGVFLVFGIVARKGAAAGLQADPVPQAMVITGIVVAFAASALAVALVLRLFEAAGQVTLNPDAWTKPPGDGASPNDGGFRRHRGDGGRRSAGAADPLAGARRAACRFSSAAGGRNGLRSASCRWNSPSPSRSRVSCGAPASRSSTRSPDMRRRSASRSEPTDFPP